MLVHSRIANNFVHLRFLRYQAGTAEITVTATDSNGVSVSDVFTVTVSAPKTSVDIGAEEEDSCPKDADDFLDWFSHLAREENEVSIPHKRSLLFSPYHQNPENEGIRNRLAEQMKGFLSPLNKKDKRSSRINHLSEALYKLEETTTRQSLGFFMR